MSAKYFREKINDALPKGVYIGDPCYILPDTVYYGVWEDQYEFEEGVIRTKGGKFVMFVSGTSFGDGVYEGKAEIQKGSEREINKCDLPVDAGVIAIVNMEFAKSDWKSDSLFDDNCLIVEEPVSGVECETDEDGSFEFRFNTKNAKYRVDTYTGEYYEDEEYVAEDDYDDDDDLDEDEY